MLSAPALHVLLCPLRPLTLAQVAGGGLGSSFIPFGSVVAASGCSVRVSVDDGSCPVGAVGSPPRCDMGAVERSGDSSGRAGSGAMAQPYFATLTVMRFDTKPTLRRSEPSQPW